MAEMHTVSEEEFWALKDVSFEISRGERVGIIGRNGAGKSTLLKILSRIIEPTTGRVEIQGRVASLLEVGTGFHPELTGRENIYLNGAILGMARREICSKFDEIVAFAEVEKFLDTPVKRYSSGMYVRLAFAVAAHLEPEILVVDEVLAVGDSGFQKKCMGKMKDVSETAGRTVILVSHQIDSIRRLCDKCMLFHRGSLVEFGSDIDSILNSYLMHEKSGKDLSSAWFSQQVNRSFQNPYFSPQEFYLSIDAKTYEPAQKDFFRRDDQIMIVIKGAISRADEALTIGYDIHDEEDNLLYRTYQTDTEETTWPQIMPPSVTLVSHLPIILNEGSYRISLRGGLHCRKWLFEPGKESPSIWLHINGGLSKSPYWYSRRPGIMAPIIKWTTL
jgi:lipopolysaccharide transport system ATP-binding protein